MKALFLVLVCFFLTQTLATTTFRVNHQASSTSEFIEVRVDGESVPEFSAIKYGSPSSYAEFDDQDTYLVSVYSASEELLLNVTLSFLPEPDTTTLFLVETPESEGSKIGGLSLVDQRTQPQKYYSNYRVINFAPTDESVDVSLDGEVIIQDLEFESQSDTMTLGAGEYGFSVVNATDGKELFSYKIVLNWGYDYTILINYERTDGSFLMFSQIDSVTEYPCEFRGVNSVPSDEKVTIVVSSETQEVSLAPLAYTEFSEYLSLPVGDYQVVFYNSSDDLVATTDLTCDSSQRYTIAFSENLEDDSYSGFVMTDSNYAPYYTESSIRIVYLTPSPNASPASVSIQGNTKPEISFPQFSSYYSVSQEDVSVVIVSLDDGTPVVNKTYGLELGTSFSLFVFGLLDDAGRATNDYPITTYLAVDFESQTYPTTTTTGGDDDDDDDDELSGGQIAGIVIGVLVGVALIAAIIFFVLRRRRAQDDTVYAQFHPQ